MAQKLIITPGVDGLEPVWLYHKKGSDDPVILKPRHHAVLYLVVIQPNDWCITHKAAPTCTCGYYALEWQEDADAAPC